jgi:ADP-ribosyl-[dinitrogen reductase] hydrolase
MRLAPVVLFYFPDEAEVVQFAALSSRTTHGAEEAVDSCRLLATTLVSALRGRTKEEVISHVGYVPTTPAVHRIAQGAYREKSASEIRGTGYAVASLEAALWCFSSTETFEEAVLTAANLGDDADTTAAIMGQIAGAHHGINGIPTRWLERLHMRTEIEELARRLFVSRGHPTTAANTPGST